MSILETRYRRLLAWFPRDHRDVHEEEMLGVLMAGARPGQQRPDPRDVADIVLGGLRMRVRRAFGTGTTDWREASTVAGVIGAVLTMLWILGPSLGMIWSLLQHWPLPYDSYNVVLWPTLAIATVAAAAMNHRWLSSVAAWVVAFLPSVHISLSAAGGGVMWHWAWNEQILLAFVTAVLLTAGRAPRRGFALLGWRATIGVVVLGFVFGWQNDMGSWFAYPFDPYPFIWALPALLTLAIAAGLVRSPVGLRVVVLLVVPALLYMLPAMVSSLLSRPVWLVLVLLLIGLVALAVGRHLRPLSNELVRVGEPQS